MEFSLLPEKSDSDPVDGIERFVVMELTDGC